MAYLSDPAMTPAMHRPNEFARSCAFCGRVLAPGEGIAFLLWDAIKQKNAWKACCDADCESNFMAGASPPLIHSGSVAAKAVADQRADEELLAKLQTAPAFTMPDAEALAPLLTKLAESMTTAIVQDVAAQFTTAVPPMVAELLASARPVDIKVGDMPAVRVDRKHSALEDVLLMVVSGASPFMVGPAGSGKTTLAQQVAQVLQRPFYMASRVSSEYKLTGFIDANGKCVRTAFREAYENGGVFLFDEVDASDADALTAFNAALAGQLADFPDGVVKRHKDFVALAAGNTFGRGADRQYVGRNQLDAATLDRFQVIEIDYDEQLELQLAGNDEWTKHVQRVRAAILAEKVRHVVSPRASISGARLLAAGMDRAKVEEACIWKGLDTTNRARVVARMAGGN